MSTPISIPVDPSLSPQAQIEPVLKTLPAIPCPSHPHVMRSVHIADTILSVLHPWGYNTRQDLEWKCQPKFAQCDDCPERRRFEIVEGCARCQGECFESIPLEADVVPLPLFEAWKQTLTPRICRYRGRQQTLPLLEAKLQPPLARYEIVPVYHPCMDCKLKACEVPPLLTSCAFSNFDPPCREADECLSKCREFAEQGSRRFLLLFGNVGTGKTHLAVAVLRHWLETRGSSRNAWFIRFSDLLRRHRETYRRKRNDHDPDESPDPLPRAQTASFLVLDEVRISGGRDEEQLLFDVVNHRLENYLPTVLTTNLTLPSLEPELGSRVIDRIREAQFATLGFNWASQRNAHNANYGQPRPMPFLS
jgi:DNA replication protein DnaC